MGRMRQPDPRVRVPAAAGAVAGARAAANAAPGRVGLAPGTPGATALRDPALAARVGVALVALVLLWPLLVASEFRPWLLWDRQSLQVLGAFLGGFVPPRHDPAFLSLLAQATWTTVAIATAGLTLAWLGAVPLALLATARLSRSAVGRPMRPLPLALRQAVRWLMVALRSVPELVWALLFVRVVGLGATAGVLAIALTYCGMLGKVYSEIVESVDAAPAVALLRNGAGRLATFLHAVLPQAAPELISYTVYRWECAVRASVIMGLVGAGGLGQRMDESLKSLAGGEVAAMLLVFVALVALADRASRWLRASIA